jgi:hypothetical protein
MALQQRGVLWLELLSEDGIWNISVVSVILILVVCVSAYVIGQILYSISRIVFLLYAAVWRRVPKNSLIRYDYKVKQLKNYLRSENIDEPEKAILKDVPVHLYFEMVAFVDRPDLHSRFIERYNVCAFMYRSLSTCLFTAGVLYIFLLPVTALPIAAEALLFFLSALLYRQYTLIEIGFMDRVFTTYVIAKEKRGLQ